MVLASQPEPITGTVLRGNLVCTGAPTPGLVVLARSATASDPESVYAATADSSGAFTIGLPESGPWELIAVDPSSGQLIRGERLIGARQAGVPLVWTLDQAH